METFVERCGLAFLAATLLATGGSHLADLRGFPRLLRHHGLLPAALAAPVAWLVTGVELAIGLAALKALLDPQPYLATVGFGAGLGIGGVFLIYLRRLLRAGRASSCGCSPLASPLTPASLVPAASLVVAGLVGLLARSSAVATSLPPRAWSRLAVAWGVALAGLVLLLPATAPGRVRGPGR